MQLPCFAVLSLVVIRAIQVWHFNFPREAETTSNQPILDKAVCCLEIQPDSIRLKLTAIYRCIIEALHYRTPIKFHNMLY
jgi:hypothetical protein